MQFLHGFAGFLTLFIN